MNFILSKRRTNCEIITINTRFAFLKEQSDVMRNKTFLHVWVYTDVFGQWNHFYYSSSIHHQSGSEIKQPMCNNVIKVWPFICTNMRGSTKICHRLLGNYSLWRVTPLSCVQRPLEKQEQSVIVNITVVCNPCIKTLCVQWLPEVWSPCECQQTSGFYLVLNPLYLHWWRRFVIVDV